MDIPYNGQAAAFMHLRIIDDTGNQYDVDELSDMVRVKAGVGAHKQSIQIPDNPDVLRIIASAISAVADVSAMLGR